MTDASLPSPSSTGRRRAAREREYRRLRILAMAPAGWSYAAIGREEAISREREPQDRRPDLRGGRERDHAMAETILRLRERHGDAPPAGSDSPIARAALDAPQAVDS